MEENKHISMEKPKKTIRKSIYTFLQNYQYFTTTPLLLIFPFSASILLSQALFSSSSSSSPSPVIQYLFYLEIINSNVLKTIFTSVSVLFLALTTLLIAKALIIQTLLYPKSSPSIAFSSFKSLFITQLCNSLLIIILNIISIYLLYIIFPLGSSRNHPLFWTFSVGVYYSFFANISAICNLALVVSVMESSFGFSAILQACLMSWSTNCGILSANLPTNLGMFAVEALFSYRIVRAYHVKGFSELSMTMEGILIIYLYSILIVLDTVASVVFFKTCKASEQTDCKGQHKHPIIVVNLQDDKVFKNSELSVIVQ